MSIKKVDIKKIEELLAIIERTDFDEVEIECNGLRLRARKSVPVPAGGYPHHQIFHQTVEQDTAPADSEEEQGFVVKSPLVGTYYQSSKPDAPPFVNIGDHVKKGQILCIVEAMKLMNEVESEVDGTVTKVFVQNANSVEYGEPLFLIEEASPK